MGLAYRPQVFSEDSAIRKGYDMVHNWLTEMLKYTTDGELDRLIRGGSHQVRKKMRHARRGNCHGLGERCAEHGRVWRLASLTELCTWRDVYTDPGIRFGSNVMDGHVYIVG